MKILAFQDEQFRVPAIPPFFLAQLNPEGYRFNHRVEYQRQQAAGTSGGPLQFNRIQPEELEFEFCSIPPELRRMYSTGIRRGSMLSSSCSSVPYSILMAAYTALAT